MIPIDIFDLGAIAVSTLCLLGCIIVLKLESDNIRKEDDEGGIF